MKIAPRQPPASTPHSTARALPISPTVTSPPPVSSQPAPYPLPVSQALAPAESTPRLHAHVSSRSAPLSLTATNEECIAAMLTCAAALRSLRTDVASLRVVGPQT